MTEQERRTQEEAKQIDRPGLSQAIQVAEDRPTKGLKRDKVFELKDVSVRYDGKPAVRDISFDVFKNQITALIGPSGCGKSTLIRCFNRMNDLIDSATVEGQILYHGEDLYGEKVDPVQARKLIGMVFQKPNPFPKSIYDNIAFGPRTVGMKGDMDEIVEKALRRGALWDEAKDRLHDNAYGMSGGQQQRLCIARCVAVQPDVIVTHNMQQAARISDMTAFLIVELDADEQNRWGRIVEYDETEKIFTNPSDKRTEDYVTGKVG